MDTTAHNALFPGLADRQSLDEWLSARVGDALGEIARGAVSPTLDLDTFQATLAGIDFSRPRPMRDVAGWVIDCLRAGLVQTTHPRYFGLFNPAPTYPAECADAISAAFNPQICVWSHAPVAVDIERHVIGQVAHQLGLGRDAGGHFTSGGSEANRTALVCALTKAAPDFSARGASAFAGQPRLYASRESHLAWLKIAHECGVGRDAVALVATDGEGRLDAAALMQQIRDDLAAACVPVMIAATAGTTNAGMVDPLPACREIADAQGIWMHTDAAWGGALIASDTLRSELAGIEQSDSVTIDAHKWFAATMGTGMFLTGRPDVLAQAFHVETDYMPSNDQSVDLYVNSSQWSRRFLGLRLFLSLASVGWAGYAAHVENGVALIDRLNQKMRRAGWRVANASRMAVTCLVPPEGSGAVDEIVARVVGSNAHWVSMTRLEGEPVVRACATNGRTCGSDIDALAAALVEAQDGLIPDHAAD